MTFFTDSDFSTPIDPDTRILVGERLYYNGECLRSTFCCLFVTSREEPKFEAYFGSVAIERPIAGLEFSVIDCTVTDEGASESYDIYRDMCVDKFVGTTVDGQSNHSEIRFSYLAFQFASATEDETREVLTCKGKFS